LRRRPRGDHHRVPGAPPGVPSPGPRPGGGRGRGGGLRALEASHRGPAGDQGLTAAGATRDGSGAGGALVLVATPIGNLGDLSPRAVQALTDADVIACEDTRKTGRLLAHAGVVDKRLLAVHDHNDAAQTRSVLALLDRGRSVAVVTDDGTPGVSVPGGRLEGEVACDGGQVTEVPGESTMV